MHAAPREGVQVHRQGGGERLAFAGTHFCDSAVVQGNTALKLNVEMTHLQRALARFAHRGVGLRQQHVEGFALAKTFAQLRSSGLQRGIVKRLEFTFQYIDLLDNPSVLLEQSVVAATEYRSEKLGQHAAFRVGED